MRVLTRRLQSHQVDDIHYAHLEIGQVFAQQSSRGKRLERRHVAGTGEHYIGLAAKIGRRPLPDADAGAAMLDGGVHIEPLRCRLLAGDDHIDHVAAAQTVIRDTQQRVCIGRQIDADDLRLLVDDVIDEAGVLMAEAVMVLAPDMRGQQIVERGDRPPPRDLLAVTLSHLAC